VVARAGTAGVELFSLTDHDTVDGVEEALAAGGAEGLRVVAGTELSALRRPDEEVHVLGYVLDHRDRRLAERLEGFRADREQRILRMAERLQQLGLELDRSEIEARRAAGKPVGRPHLAQAALRVDANASRLRAEAADEREGFFARYLVPGAAAYLPRLTPTVEEAIAAIHEAGGVAVWAHPFWDVASLDEVLAEVERFRGQGLDGVECFYPTHTAEQVQALCDHCEERGLLRTGSSDFHGPGHSQFGDFLAFELYGREPELGPIAG
jgi:predicted metal-dependent phosphoesterase TrpH